MCKCANCDSNCIRDETVNTPQTNQTEKADTIEINCLKLPEELYDAICVLNGRYGTGIERKSILGSKYEKVQAIVNQIAYLYD